MKAINFVIKKVSEDSGLPRDQVKIVITKYWDEIYRRILSLDDTTIAIRHVGVITVSKFKLNKYISKRIHKIRTVRGSDFTERKKEYLLTHHYERLKKALIKRNELAIQYSHDKNNKRIS